MRRFVNFPGAVPKRCRRRRLQRIFRRQKQRHDGTFRPLHDRLDNRPVARQKFEKAVNPNRRFGKVLRRFNSAQQIFRLRFIIGKMRRQILLIGLRQQRRVPQFIAEHGGRFVRRPTQIVRLQLVMTQFLQLVIKHFGEMRLSRRAGKRRKLVAVRKQ